MWIFNLILAPVDISREVVEWLEDSPYKRFLDTDLREDGWLVITGSDLNLAQLNSLIQPSPKLIKDLLYEISERSHAYLEGKYALDPASVNEGSVLLQRQKNFLVTAHWDPLEIKPFENIDEYHRRLVGMISIQTVLEEVVRVADNFDLDWDKGISITYKGIFLDVNSFINALKHRERRKFIPLIKRLLLNSRKIRELRLNNLELILSNNLKDCK